MIDALVPTLAVHSDSARWVFQAYSSKEFSSAIGSVVRRRSNTPTSVLPATSGQTGDRSRRFMIETTGRTGAAGAAGVDAPAVTGQTVRSASVGDSRAARRAG